MGLAENGVAIKQVSDVQVFPWVAGQTGPPTLDSSKSIGPGMQEFELALKGKVEYTRAAAYDNARTGGYAQEMDWDVNAKGDQVFPANWATQVLGSTGNSSLDAYSTGQGGTLPLYTLLVTGLYMGAPKTLWVPKFGPTPEGSLKPDFKQFYLGYKFSAFIDGSASYTAKSVAAPLVWYIVDTPVVALSSLTVSATSPADTTTGVAVGVAPTITFGQAVNGVHVNTSNFFLVRDDTDAIVTATVGFQDTAHKVVQVTPGSNLVSGKKYRLVVAPNRVADIYGNVYAGQVTYFTCA